MTRKMVEETWADYPNRVDTAHAAEMLGTSVSRLNVLARTGEIAWHRRPGDTRRRFYHKDDLIVYLLEQQTKWGN